MMKKGWADFVLSMLATPLGMVLSSLAILAAGIAVGMWRTKKIIESMSGLKMPNMKVEYSAHVDALAESWRQVNVAVRDATAAYDSLTEASERAMEVTKLDFELKRKNLEAQGYADGSPEQLALNKEERAQKIKDLEKQQEDALKDQKKAIDQAAKVHTGDPAKQAATLAALKTGIDDPEVKKQVEEAKERQRQRQGGGYFDPTGFMAGIPGANAAAGALGVGAQTSDFFTGTSAEGDQALIDGYNARQKHYQAEVDKGPGRANSKKEQETLQARAVGFGEKAVAIKGQIEQLKKTDPKQDAIELAESLKPRAAHSINSTEWQRAGLGMGGPGLMLLDVNKQQLMELKKINDSLKAKSGGTGGVNFGGGSR
jgi:hypothetical protein